MLYMDYILHVNEIVAVCGYYHTLYTCMIRTGTLVKNICKDVIARYVPCCSGNLSWFGFLCFWMVHKKSKVMTARTVWLYFHMTHRLRLSLSLTFLPVCFDVICCYFIFNRQEYQGCLSKTNRIWTKQILVYQSWFLLHCSCKRKLIFIMCFDLVMQTCSSDELNSQLLRDNPEKRIFQLDQTRGGDRDTPNKTATKKPATQRKTLQWFWIDKKRTGVMIAEKNIIAVIKTILWLLLTGTWQTIPGKWDCFFSFFLDKIKRYVSANG